MTTQDATTVHTRLGPATVRFVEHWMGIGPDGELVERALWDVTWEADDLRVTQRLSTYPGPSRAALARSVAALLRRSETTVASAAAS